MWVKRGSEKSPLFLKYFYLNDFLNKLKLMDTTNPKVSSKTMERVQIAKSYIEKKYKMKKDNEEQKKQGKV